MEHGRGHGHLDDPLNIHVCLNKVMKPLMIVFPILVMLSIVWIKVLKLNSESKKEFKERG